MRWLVIIVAFLCLTTLSKGQNFVPNTLVFKLKAGFEDELKDGAFIRSDLKSFSDRYGLDEIELMFPIRDLARETHGLRNIYVAHFSKDFPIQKAINYYQQTGIFEYVEQKPIHRLTHTPNDTLISQQSFLDIIRAKEAWDIEMGSSGVVIGIVDTGIETDHPDLQTKIVVNTADPVDGNDNDGDGYVDNNLGWDFVDNDGDPSYSDSDHGTHVAGVAAAATNNITGVAGVGYNCKVLPIKSGDRLTITHGFEGIVYAADHGASVINCSWGNYYPSHAGQDAVDYARSKGSVIVAAGGNEGGIDDYYPAAYDGVLAVSGSSPDDSKAGISNYGFYMDISAPAQQVLGTVGNHKYNVRSGTSMSAPMVAGAAALLKSHRPTLQENEIAAILKQTSDSIDYVTANQPYRMMLGNGRLNVERALQRVDSAQIEMVDYSITDNNDQWLGPIDTVSISLDIRSIIGPSSNVDVKLISRDNYLVVLNPNKSLGSINKDQTVQIDSLILFVDPAVPINHISGVEVELTSDQGTSRHFIRLDLNTNYIDVSSKDLTLTVTSYGLVGYNIYPEIQGNGLVFESGSSLLYEGGFAFTAYKRPYSLVSDRLRGANDVGQTDFVSTESIHREVNDTLCDIVVKGSFNDVGAPEPIEIVVDQTVWTCDKPGLESVIFLRYDVTNIGQFGLSNVYGGLFMDFDIGDFEKNEGRYDGQRFMTYTFSRQVADSGLYLGVQLIEPSIFHTYLISAEDGGEGGIEIGDADWFTDDEKRQVMDGGKHQAGTNGGTDVFQVVAGRTANTDSGETETFIFAVMAARSLDSLQMAADSAYNHYHGELPASLKIISRNDGLEVFPNPARDQISFRSISEIEEITLMTVGGATIDIDDAIKRSPDGQTTAVGLARLAPGVYFYRVLHGGEISFGKMVKE